MCSEGQNLKRIFFLFYNLSSRGMWSSIVHCFPFLTRHHRYRCALKLLRLHFRANERRKAKELSQPHRPLLCFIAQKVTWALHLTSVDEQQYQERKAGICVLQWLNVYLIYQKKQSNTHKNRDRREWPTEQAWAVQLISSDGVVWRRMGRCVCYIQYNITKVKKAWPFQSNDMRVFF